MSEETLEVDAKQFEDLCKHYSGDALGKNTCKTVVFANRLWTVTGIVSGGKIVPSVELHELVLPDQYDGPTGSYPFDSDGVFYKGQVVKARGRTFVMSGRKLEAVCTGSAPDSQLDLLGWREECPAPGHRAKRNAPEAKPIKQPKRPAAKTNGTDRSKPTARARRKIKRR